MSKPNDLSHIEFFPINDFSEFEGPDPVLSNCKVILSNGEVIHAHAEILANGSEFFFSAFTSGMAEDVNREVNISFNPQNLFPAVVQYLYSEQINVEDDQIMSLFAIAKYYGIASLYEEVNEFLKTQTNQTNIIQLIQQCYENELASELDYLIPRISELLPYIDMGALSDNLDLPTFCRILQHYNGNASQKVNFINMFLGDYQCTDQDIQSVLRLFDSNNFTDMQIFCILLEHYGGSPIEKMGLFTSFNGSHRCSKQDQQLISRVFNLNDPDVISAYQTLRPAWAPSGATHGK